MFVLESSGVLTSPIRETCLHVVPPRSVISGWHRYCADYIVPVCIQWDGPQQRREGGSRGVDGGERKRRGDAPGTLYWLSACKRTRGSLKQWIVLEDVIVRSLPDGLRRVLHGELQISSFIPPLPHYSNYVLLGVLSKKIDSSARRWLINDGRTFQLF